jgi:hypothetical protein
MAVHAYCRALSQALSQGLELGNILHKSIFLPEESVQ